VNQLWRTARDTVWKWSPSEMRWVEYTLPLKGQRRLRVS
jgi:hypothetical protein